MRNSSLIILYIFPIVIFALSCGSREKLSKFKLSKEELTEMISLLDSENDSKLNYHIIYSEQFNDSTIVLEVWQNQNLADEELGVCDYFKYKGGVVIVYDDLMCAKTLPKSLVSTNNKSFFVPGSHYWQVLIKRRENQLKFYKIDLFTPYNENLKIDEGLDEDLY